MSDNYNTVYTSLQGFKLKNRQVKGCNELNDELVEWITEKSATLLTRKNTAELLAGKELMRLYGEVHQQVYFRIFGRSYFLDYYLPKEKIAVEIDGSYHKDRKMEDKQRDSDFLTIGIRTIRIKSSVVLSGKFTDCFLSAVSSLKKKAKKKHRKKKPSELKEAMKRLHEHDQMKHHATWI